MVRTSSRTCAQWESASKKAHMKANNAYGAWLMDAAWAELKCSFNVARADVELLPLPNEAYKAIPVKWPPTSGVESWNDENTGNVWEAWAGTLWLTKQRERIPPNKEDAFLRAERGRRDKGPMCEAPHREGDAHMGCPRSLGDGHAIE